MNSSGVTASTPITRALTHTHTKKKKHYTFIVTNANVLWAHVYWQCSLV